MKTDVDWKCVFDEAMNAPGALGDTYTRFYNYSFLNQIRLYMQGVAEPVATYRRWQELGRQVRKGAHAKIVFAPIMVNKQVENKDGVPQIDSQTGKPMKRQVMVGFRASKTVFGYSDTDGDEIPATPPRGWDSATALAALNVEQVSFDVHSGNVQGFSREDENGRLMSISPVARYPFKTMFHELAHLVLGHCKALAEGDEMHRGVGEFEAEATAYLVAKELHMVDWDASESRAYIQRWLTGIDVSENIDHHMQRVFSAVNKILTAGRSKSTDGVVAAA